MQPTDDIPPVIRKRLLAYVALLATAFVAASAFLYDVMRSNRDEAAARHAARIDPNAPDPGLTSSERDLPPGTNPTRVVAGFYVDRVLELSVKDGSWTVEFYLWFRWRGDGLKTCKDFQLVDATVESRDEEADETIAGERYQRYRVVAKVTKHFDVTRYPRDEHLLTLAVELPGSSRSEALFVADEAGTSVSSRVRVAAYKVGKPTVLEKPHSYKTSRGDPRVAEGSTSMYSQLRMGVPVHRDGWGLYFKLFQSLFVAVVLAMLAFFIRPTEVDPRFGLGVGALFAGVANAYVISSLVPDTGVMAMADVVNGVGIAVILLSVVQSAVSLHLYANRGLEAVSRRFDRLSFAVFLPGYVVLNLALALGA